MSHLDISVELKQIFKTATEIDQLKIIEYVVDRQKYVCQGQSLNLFIKSSVTKKDIHTLHFRAWELGCKGLYYYRRHSDERAENVSLECSECVA